MMNSVRSFWARQTNIPHWLPWFFVALALIGFSDATYLTVKHVQHAAPTCSIIEGCDVVTGSAYATIGPVPIALLGALFYLTIIILTVAFLDTKHSGFMRLVALCTIAGFLFSLWLVYLQLFVLHAICLYCMGSATTSTLLFIGGMIIFYHSHKTYG